MRPRTIIYNVSEGVKNLFKNRLMSLASIMTIVASLFIVSVFYCVMVNLQYTMDQFEHRIGIAVFFNEGTTENQILTLKNQLEARDEIYQVTYTSAEEAWDTFKEDYFNGREELLEGFGDDNPLSGSASLQVLFDDVSKQEDVVGLLEQEDIVRYVRDSGEMTEILQSLNKFVTYVSAALIIILAIISLFVISNTIRLAITLRKREINIMRYMGAKTSMIRGPFLVEGALIGLIGGAIPSWIIYAFYEDVVVRITTQFYLLNDFLSFLTRQQLMAKLTPMTLLVGVLLGIIASRFTVGRYLKV